MYKYKVHIICFFISLNCNREYTKDYRYDGGYKEIIGYNRSYRNIIDYNSDFNKIL